MPATSVCLSCYFHFSRWFPLRCLRVAHVTPRFTKRHFAFSLPPPSPQLWWSPSPPPAASGHPVSPPATGAKVDRQPERGYDLCHPVLMNALSRGNRGRQGGWHRASLCKLSQGTPRTGSTARQSPLHKELLLMPPLQPIDGMLGRAGFSTT